MNIPFSDRQKSIISSAITGLALLTLFLLAAFTFKGIVQFITTFSSVLLPLATAGVLSLLLRPVYQFLTQKRRFPPVAAIACIMGLLLLPGIIIFGVFGGLLVSQINELVNSIPASWENLKLWMQQNTPAVEMYLNKIGGWEKIQEWLQGQSGTLLSLAAVGGQGVLSMVGSIVGLFSWAVLPVYLIFMLIAPMFSYDKLEEFMPFLKKDQREDVIFLIRQFVEIVVVFFRGQLLIAFAQGGLMAVGFSIIGLPYGFILGLIFGMLNLVPYLGNLIGMLITLPLAWFCADGGLGMLIGVLVVLGIVQVVEGYVLTPKIMGKSTGLHPMAVIFAMFFWGTALSGMLGLILAIPLTAFLVVFWRLAKEKYLPKIKERPVE
ncbi:AI-2E family transporter [Kiritimatiellaeota bacterium B1221]|nr:AI-2E family transporter [Kiritimatiellaeota bacterium B1221]